jgi:hypothetical protein
MKHFVLPIEKDGIYQDIGQIPKDRIAGEMVKVIPSEDNTQKRRFTVGRGRRMEKASIQQHLNRRGKIHGVMTS